MNDFMPDRISIPDGSESHFSATEIESQKVIINKETLRQTENSEETIRHLLSTYDLGAKLRQLRLRKKIALVDLGKHTGFSASMLSQLENGKLVPTLPTLARIAMVFDVGLEHFFADKRARRVFSIVRAGERLRFPDRADSPTPGYFFEVLRLARRRNRCPPIWPNFRCRKAKRRVRTSTAAPSSFTFWQETSDQLPGRGSPSRTRR